MENKLAEKFTKYEIARILGARALQIAMDAPILLKIEEEKLKEISYDPLKIAELELSEGALPIAINRPLPRRGSEKLTATKEDKLSDEEIIEKAQEVEKEIVEDADQLGFAQQDEETEDTELSASKNSEETQ